MRRRDYSALAFTLLSSFTCFFLVANSQEIDVSDNFFGPLPDPNFDSLADVDFFGPNTNSLSPATFTLDDSPTENLLWDSNNLLGQDDLFGSDLMLSSDDECSFEAASIDAEDYMNSIEKREVGQTCKTPQRGSSSNEPSPPPEDPQNFLNNLPFFKPHEDPAVSNEDLVLCDPRFVGGRSIPMCLIGRFKLIFTRQNLEDLPSVSCLPRMSLYFSLLRQSSRRV